MGISVCYTLSMQGWYFYTAVAGLVGGIAMGTVFSVPVSGILWLIGLAGVVGVVAGRNRSAISARYLWTLSIVLLAVALGSMRVNYSELTPANPTLTATVGQTVTLEGVVAREPERRESSTHLYVRVGDETILAFTDRTTTVAYGDAVQLVGELALPEAFETDLGRTFNYAGYLRARDVEFIIRWADVTVVASDQGNWLLAYLFRFKTAFLASVAGLIPEPQAGLGDGLLLGVKSALGEDLEQAFRQTGIIHIVVLSGYNVMIVAEAVMRLLATVLLPRARMVVGIIAITTFAVLVGLGATVVRASIMAGLVLIARATGNVYGVTRALMFAGVVMLLLNPYLLLYDPGFQLSFLASLGLILVAPHIERLVGFAPTTLQIREFLTATIATQIFVLPLLLYSIGEFSVVSVVVNVLVLPVVPLAMLLVFVSGLVGFLSPTLALPLAWLANLVLTYIITIAEWFAVLPFASFIVPAFPFWVVPLSYAVLGYWLWYLQRNVLWDVPRHVPNSKETISVSDWEVVEEVELKTKAAGRGPSPRPAAEPPVFFR